MDFLLSESNSIRTIEDNSQEDCLPFLLDDDSSGPEGSPSFSKRKSSMKSTDGFAIDTRFDGRDATSSALNNVDLTSRYHSGRHSLENTSFRPDINKFSNANLTDRPKSIDQGLANVKSGGTTNSIV